VQDANAETASLHAQVATINQLIEQRQKQKQEISELEAKVGKVKASRDKLYAVIDHIEDSRYEVNGNLDVTTSAMPDSVDLTNVTHASNELTINGMAPNEAAVLEYATNLRASARFTHVIISSMKKTEKGTSFTLTLKSG
jgi:Tfp pilus assembly protein PilN